ncbi:hypothetical protein DWF04_005990 [Cereibacter sphaeroides f. sp. denitrificans]
MDIAETPAFVSPPTICETEPDAPPERALPSCWWLVPSLVLGACIWGMLLRGLMG